MKFLGLSKLSDEELERLSHEIVDTHGDAARDVVIGLIDKTNASGDFVEHAKWMNILLGVMQIQMPERFEGR